MQPARRERLLWLLSVMFICLTIWGDSERVVLAQVPTPRPVHLPLILRNSLGVSPTITPTATNSSTTTHTPTITLTRTPRPTFTALPTDTSTMTKTVTATPTETMTPTPSPTSTLWRPILAERFEGIFPGVWELVTNIQSYNWGKSACRVDAGDYSGWALGGGTIGAHLPCGSNYVNNLEVAMIYGPFSLVGATQADVLYRAWFNTELEADWLSCLASVDGEHFYGQRTTGISQGYNGWQDRRLDLTNVRPLGNLVGRSQVWVAFVFKTDATNVMAEGAYLDDIVIRQYIPATSGAVPRIVTPGPRDTWREAPAEWVRMR